MPTTRQFIAQKLKAGIAALVPCCCVLCARETPGLLCAACRQQYFGQSPRRCRQCAIPLLQHEVQPVCGDCLSTPPAFGRSIVAVDYSAPLDQLVLALKFGHRLALASLFADSLRDAILREACLPLPDILCPVPLGQQRLQERGFNQSLEIAKPLCQNLGVPLQPELLRRTRNTAQQSSLHPDDRHKNVRNAFALNESAIDFIRGKHIGLVDDVMTTGTTLNEIAALLKRFGAASVNNYVFARTPRH